MTSGWAKTTTLKEGGNCSLCLLSPALVKITSFHVELLLTLFNLKQTIFQYTKLMVTFTLSIE